MKNTNVDLLVDAKRPSYEELEHRLALLEGAQEALREFETNLSKAQSIARFANWEMDLNTEKIRGSAELYRIFNLRGELSLRIYAEKFHPDDRAYIVESINAAIREGKPYEIEYRIIPSPGDIRYVHAWGELARDENGHPLKFLGIIQDITERKLLEKTQLFLAQSAGAFSDKNFFASLAQHLSDTLGVDYVCIDRLEGNRLSARTLAVFCEGRFEDNITYDLENTPCGEVLKKHVCLFPKGVHRLFPKDAVLQEMGAESYVGTILWDKKGEPIGLIAAIGRHPLANPHLAESILRLASIRATGELERKQVEDTVEQAQKTLARERNILRNMIDSAYNSHLAFLDRDFNFVRVNEAYAKACGYTPDEMVGKNHFALYPHEENEAIFAGVRDSGIPVKYNDKPFVFPDQPERGVTYWDWTLTPVRNPSGPIEGLVLSLFETTERKHAEKALRESEAKYRTLFETMTEGVALHEMIYDQGGIAIDYRIIAVNPAFEKQTGLKLDHAQGKLASSLYGTGQPPYLESYARVAQSGQPISFETFYQPMGQYFHISAFSPNRDFFVTVFENITEQKRMEGELKKSNEILELRVRARTADLTILNQQLLSEIERRKQAEQILDRERLKLKNILNSMQDGAYIVDSNHDIQYVNPAVEKQFGTFDGRKCFDYLYDLKEPCAWCKIKEVTAEACLRWEQYSHKTKKFYEIISTPYVNDNGTILKLDILRDITRRKEAEVSLQNALLEIKKLKDRLEAENVYFQKEIKTNHQNDQIIGQSNAIQYVLYRAEQVAPTSATVLILGETGTGKGVLAATIHQMSPCRERPLITVNCAALPSNLIESELFGRERGAYTGSDARQVGRFELADHSTICLDEIAELPRDVQSKLLRVLQTGEFERLGSSRTIKANARVVATTNRDLEQEVRKGRFREDLFYRLNVFPLTVPPLRKRKEDIPALVQYMTERYGKKMGKRFSAVSRETLQELQAYNWPGNIRELENVIERAVILCSGPVLCLADRLESPSMVSEGSLKTMEEAERDQILKTLEQTHWRINGPNGAAEILDLPPSTLRSRMHKLGIHRSEFK